MPSITNSVHFIFVRFGESGPATLLRARRAEPRGKRRPLFLSFSLEDTQAARFVMMGVLTNGQRVVLAVESGQRESQESWGLILRDLRKRGLKPWRCTSANGHLGLWVALGEQYPNIGRAKVLESSPDQCAGRNAQETAG